MRVARFIHERANSKKYTFQGVTGSLQWWAEVTGIKLATLQTRLKYGWTVERAFTQTPTRTGYQRGSLSIYTKALRS